MKYYLKGEIIFGQIWAFVNRISPRTVNFFLISWYKYKLQKYNSMKRITIFAVLLLTLAIDAYSQRTFTYNSEQYYILPDTFYSHIAASISYNAGYISSFNLPDGKWISLTKGELKDFPLATGTIANGHPEGIWYFYSVNWDDTTSYITSSVPFKKGIAEGDYFYFHNNGKVSGHYEVKGNKFHGKSLFYDQKGNLSLEGAHMYGNRSGTWKFYGYTGKLIRIESYLEQVPNVLRSSVLKQFTEEGNDRVETETGMTKNLVYIPYAEGPWITYDDEGKPAEEKTFSSGMVIYVKRYSDGILVSEGETAGEIEPGPQKRSYSPPVEKYIKKGVWKYYDKNGNLLRTEVFE